MSSAVLPSLPGFFAEPSVTPSYANTVHETISRKKQVTNWSSSPINGYHLAWNVLNEARAAPSPWAAYNEKTIIRYFYDVHLGDWDSWLMTDPFTGSQVRVRFVADSLKFARIGNGLWSAEADVETAL